MTTTQKGMIKAPAASLTLSMKLIRFRLLRTSSMVQPLTKRLNSSKTYCSMPTSLLTVIKEKKDQQSSLFMEVAIKVETNELDVNLHNSWHRVDMLRFP